MTPDPTAATALQAEIAKHSRNKTVALYGQAQESELSLSELFETIDPTQLDPDGQPAGPDAFERQLALAGIITSGRKSTSLGSFVTGPGLILLPEFITREITRGYQMVQDPTELLAAVVPDDSPVVKPIYLQTTEARKTASKRAEAAGYPVSKLLYREKEIPMQDRGRQFDFSYQILRNQRVPEFTAFLNFMGAQIASDELDEIYTTLLDGDGTSPAAVDVFNGGAGTLAYTDIVHLALSFDGPTQMTHILGLGSDIEVILNLTPFQDATAWRATELFARTGDYRSFLPLHSKLVICSGATTTKVIGLDARFAIKETVASPLMVEAEKIITQKLETAVISKEACYSIMIDEARKLTDY